MRILTLFTAFVISAGNLSPVVQRPDFTGEWILDGFMGRGPLGFKDPRENRALCQMPSVPAGVPAMESPDGSAEQMQSIGNVDGQISIKQSATEMSVERRYSGSLGGGTHKDVFKLDGTESVTTVGSVRSTTRVRWEGAALVAAHQLRWTASAKEVGCNIQETFTLTDTNTLRIEAVNNEAENVTSSRQTYVRKR